MELNPESVATSSRYPVMGALPGGAVQFAVKPEALAAVAAVAVGGPETVMAVIILELVLVPAASTARTL
jgi:hypothetical protein